MAKIQAIALWFLCVLSSIDGRVKPFLSHIYWEQEKLITHFSVKIYIKKPVDF